MPDIEKRIAELEAVIAERIESGESVDDDESSIREEETQTDEEITGV